MLNLFGEVGGQEYLAQQARENPATFLALVGKVLPLQVKADGADPTLPARRIVHEHRPSLAEPAALPQQPGVQRLPTCVTTFDRKDDGETVTLAHPEGCTRAT